MSERSVFSSVEARIRQILTARQPGRLGDLDPRRPRPRAGELVPAAVAVLLERAPGYSVVFTKRTHSVEHHKGEISLAGGMQDPADPDLVATGLREVHEEIGIEPSCVTVLGRLDTLVTVTGFVVTPIVAAIDANAPMRAHAPEVERILHVPLTVLRDPHSWFDDVRKWRGSTYHLRSCRYQGDIIWGATSRILQHFLAVIPPDVL